MKCAICDRERVDGVYCGRCEKIQGDVMVDVKAELGV
jgi:hypothetical protein